MANPFKENTVTADKDGAGLLSNQQANVADAVVAHSITDAAAELDAANETELEGFLDALGGKINSILAILEAHGLMKDS